jgi:hypothetical protein
MSEPLSRGLLLRFLKEALKGDESGSQSRLVASALNKMSDAGLLTLPPDRGAGDGAATAIAENPYLEKLVAECNTFLVFQGIIVPRPAVPPDHRPEAAGEFLVTDYGREWAESDLEPIPEDTVSYSRFLKDNVAGIDPVIAQYIGEALNTFNRGFLMASAVLLGAASEKLVYLLAEALIASPATAAVSAALPELLERRRLGPLCDGVFGMFDRLAGEGRIPYEIHEESAGSLRSLFAAIRIQRDDAVRPVSENFSKGQLRLLLLSFPHVCRKAYDFLSWLRANPGA